MLAGLLAALRSRSRCSMLTSTAMFLAKLESSRGLLTDFLLSRSSIPSILSHAIEELRPDLGAVGASSSSSAPNTMMPSFSPSSGVIHLGLVLVERAASSPGVKCSPTSPASTASAARASSSRKEAHLHQSAAARAASTCLVLRAFMGSRRLPSGSKPAVAFLARL